MLKYARKIVEPQIFTKGKEWEYEMEYRLVIPGLIPKEKKWDTGDFREEDLSEIYLGARMPEETKLKIRKLALAVNPNIKIYQTHLAKREYRLEFSLVPQG